MTRVRVLRERQAWIAVVAVLTTSAAWLAVIAALLIVRDTAFSIAWIPVLAKALLVAIVSLLRAHGSWILGAFLVPAAAATSLAVLVHDRSRGEARHA